MPPGHLSVQGPHEHVQSFQHALQRRTATGEKVVIATLPRDYVVRDSQGKDWNIEDGAHLALRPGDRLGDSRMGSNSAWLGLKIAAGVTGTAAVALVIGMLAVGMSDRNRMMGYGYGGYGGGYGGYGSWI